ncbi:hypothetical protein K505DRAFT_298355 [Melanomma pulvis-pyrius CBS 109.77]|uniref:Integral membrane protein n=1 Tax=Melanomma pulvis-pyrius CBS 109.77 TaxID=1314802 RepID=A0A6A6XLK0_9PLEO|nr:hypothetical protein K505DRAFT_298355 [Melanomma pulvis-pyrius CBS 109.77]
MPLSTHPITRPLATIFGTITLGFGINYVFNPASAYDIFEFPRMSTQADQDIMNSVMILYGAKDLFMGLAIYASTWFGNRKSAGLILLAASGAAGIDGFIVNRVTGGGEWNHWGYGSVMGVLGLVMTGVLG